MDSCEWSHDPNKIVIGCKQGSQCNYGHFNAGRPALEVMKTGQLPTGSGWKCELLDFVGVWYQALAGRVTEVTVGRPTPGFAHGGLEVTFQQRIGAGGPQRAALVREGDSFHCGHYYLQGHVSSRKRVVWLNSEEGRRHCVAAWFRTPPMERASAIERNLEKELGLKMERPARPPLPPSFPSSWESCDPYEEDSGQPYPPYEAEPEPYPDSYTSSSQPAVPQRPQAKSAFAGKPGGKNGKRTPARPGRAPQTQDAPGSGSESHWVKDLGSGFQPPQRPVPSEAVARAKDPGSLSQILRPPPGLEIPDPPVPSQPPEPDEPLKAGINRWKVKTFSSKATEAAPATESAATAEAKAAAEALKSRNKIATMDS